MHTFFLFVKIAHNLFQIFRNKMNFLTKFRYLLLDEDHDVLLNRLYLSIHPFLSHLLIFLNHF